MNFFLKIVVVLLYSSLLSAQRLENTFSSSIKANLKGNILNISCTIRNTSGEHGFILLNGWTILQTDTIRLGLHPIYSGTPNGSRLLLYPQKIDSIVLRGTSSSEHPIAFFEPFFHCPIFWDIPPLSKRTMRIQLRVWNKGDIPFIKEPYILRMELTIANDSVLKECRKIFGKHLDECLVRNKVQSIVLHDSVIYRSQRYRRQGIEWIHKPAFPANEDEIENFYNIRKRELRLKTVIGPRGSAKKHRRGAWK